MINTLVNIRFVASISEMSRLWLASLPEQPSLRHNSTYVFSG